MNLSPLSACAPVALACLILSCNKQEKIDSSRKVELDKLVRELKTQFHVRESKITGPRMVVLFSDIHDPDNMKKTQERIEDVQRKFSYQLFGFEGESGSSPFENESIFEREEQIYKSDSNLSLTADEIRQHGMVIDPATEFRGSYTTLKKSSAYEVLGLEKDQQSLLKIHLLLEVQDFLREVSDFYTKNGFVVIGINGKRTPSFHRFLKAQEYLKEDPEFSSMPTLFYSLSDAPIMKAEGESLELRIVYKNNWQNFDQAREKLQNWISSNMVYERNRIAAENIDRHMATKGLKNAGAVFGLAHTIDANRDRMSLQSHLAEKCISYIVIDASPVKVERTQSEIKVIIK